MSKKIEFPRHKDYIYKRELGQGACGRTVVVYDPMIDEDFVCKKYSPIVDIYKEELFDNFINEIKILHLLNYKNIVRVFTYFLYPEKFVGYIFMELIDGDDIDDYISKFPEDINNIFRQVVEGFYHLEKKDILHRDIRPMNILVNNEGVVKIIDFGFGKQIVEDQDFDKSISLNWWCVPPDEFDQSLYNHTTEVYFIGKLFQQIIDEQNINGFQYQSLLDNMCLKQPSKRINSFAKIRRQLLSEESMDIEFDYFEQQKYQEFSDWLYKVISKIERNTKYYDIETIENKLEDILKSVMLEKEIPQNSLIASCFLNGAYYYSNRELFPVDIIKEFVELLRTCSREKKNIILSNLQTKMDAIKRYDESEILDDLPF